MRVARGVTDRNPAITIITHHHRHTARAQSRERTSTAAAAARACRSCTGGTENGDDVRDAR